MTLDAPVILSALFFTVIAIIVASTFLAKKPAPKKEQKEKEKRVYEPQRAREEPPAPAVAPVKVVEKIEEEPRAEAPLLTAEPVTPVQVLEVKADLRTEDVSAVPPVIEDVGVVEEQPAVEPEVIAAKETPVQVTPEPESKPEPVAVVESAPVEEPISVPEPVCSETEPILESVKEPATEPVPEPVKESASAPEPEPVVLSEPVTEPVPEPVPEVPEPAPETPPEPIPVPTAEVPSEPTPEPVPVPAPESSPEPPSAPATAPEASDAVEESPAPEALPEVLKNDEVAAVVEDEGEIPDVGSKTNKFETILTKEELEEEQRVQQEQLAAIFRLLCENQDTFGEMTEGEMEEQLKLYSL